MMRSHGARWWVIGALVAGLTTMGASPCDPDEPEPEPACGDGVCQPGAGETLATCGLDCHVCGDGQCDNPESPATCAADCCGTCGDGICALSSWGCGETAASCVPDCKGTVCGNGICEKGENPEACDADCGAHDCGNDVCEPPEGPATCPGDCAAVCGDCDCEGTESFETCPEDCGYCGDGVCSSCAAQNENEVTCFADCGSCESWCPADPGETCCGFCCEPKCAGKMCGDDGCAGSCGTCGLGKFCIDGMCLTPLGGGGGASVGASWLVGATATPTCPDDFCDWANGESPATCAQDCVSCGNGFCEPGEGPVECPMDCCGTCGDAICATYGNCPESKDTCPLDCGALACGNGVCEPGENPTVCAVDCVQAACGNGVCEPTEGLTGPTPCLEDCAAACGNCICEGTESYLTCPLDCGWCGDGYCSDCPQLGEVDGCPADCGVLTCKPGCDACSAGERCCEYVFP